jgi:asparagine synthase (glutamine-hydrolysing)
MCGFSGYFNLDSTPVSTNCTIRQMIKLQNHRGPDDSGIVGIEFASQIIEPIQHTEEASFQNPVDLIFGFNRLSILDLSPNGHQPMVNPAGDVVMMMNGEIYNAFDYKNELLTKGYVFKSQTDTEVALYLYCEYGLEGMLQRLNGMFAFAIADLKKQTLFLARDRFGIKPLYILLEENRIAFSSEMKSFKALQDFKFELDKKQLSEFLLFRNLVNKTLFKNIENLEPGSYAEIGVSKGLVIKKYYDIRNEGNTSLFGLSAYNELKSSLDASVKRQMISDVKLGCQLSGGVDSSLVTYFASKILEKGNLETVSVIFENKNFTEKKFIDIVAGKLKLLSHQFELKADYYFEVMDQATWHFEQPINHPNTIGIYLLSEQAKKHVTVLLSGEGADEALSGYSRFVTAKQSAYLSRNFLKELKKNKKDLKTFVSYYSNPENRMILGAAFGTFTNAARIYPAFNWKIALQQRKEILKTVAGKDGRRHRKYELLTYLPDLLMRQDKMSMAHSIENRVPFLDNEMITTSLNIDENELIKEHKGKVEAKKILKDLCSEKFDEDFAYRDKMGFGIPLKDFFGSEAFKERWENDLLPGIKKRGLFNSDYTESLFRNLKNSTPADLDTIWLMTGFEIWAKQYLD